MRGIGGPKREGLFARGLVVSKDKLRKIRNAIECLR